MARKIYKGGRNGIGMRSLARIFHIQFRTMWDVLTKHGAYRYHEFSEREEKFFLEKWGNDPYIDSEVLETVRENQG